jgi:carboxyl-terminal processing protease
MNKIQRGRGIFAGNCLRVTATVFLITCTNTAWCAKAEAASVDYKKEFKDILGRIERQHYTEIKFSKEHAGRWVSRFIGDLDHGKNLFSRDEVDELVRTYTKKAGSVGPKSLSAMEELYAHIAERALKTSVLVDSILAGPIDTGGQKYYQFSVTWPATAADREREWKLKLQSEIVEWQQSGDTVDNARQALSAVYKRGFGRLAEANAATRFELIVNSLLSAVDPHMSFNVKSAPTDFSEINLMSGIGVTLQLKHGMIEIVEVYKNSPAERAGTIRPGDRIIAIAQPGGGYEAVNGLLLDDVVKSMRGPPGSVVRLRLRNPSGVFESAVTRDKYSLAEEFIRHSLHDAAFGKRQLKLASIHLPAFYMDYAAASQGKRDYKSSTRDMKMLLEKLDKQGIDGIVLDLRDNGGGSLSEGGDVASLFVGRNPVLQLKYRSSIQVLTTRIEAIVKKPLVVLVNEKSAGSSEIVAAAIQDYGIGLVMGQPTYGLGTIQNVDQTPIGMLKFTQAEYFRASGHSFQWLGVTPDITLPLPRITTKGEIKREKDEPVSLTPMRLPAVKYSPSTGLDAGVFAEQYSAATHLKYSGLINALNEHHNKGKALDYATAKADAAELAALEKNMAAYGDMEQQEALKILAELVLRQK